MRTKTIFSRIISATLLFACVLFAINTSLAQEENARPESSVQTSQSEFVSVATGGPQLVNLMVQPSVNRVYTPPLIDYSRAPQGSTINVNFNPSSCASATLASVEPWPSQARTSFLQAISIYEALFTSSVTIEVDACWRPLGPGVLGSAGSLNSFTDGQFVYPVSLANALSGQDLDPGTSDIITNFSSEFNWYFGLDGNTPPTQLDFVSVILHELAHGFGFSGSMQVGQIGGTGPVVGLWGGGGGIPASYDQFVENGANQSIINTSIFPNPSVALRDQVTSNNLFFDGPQTRIANGGQRAPLYAPSNWSQGSSYSHLAESFNDTENALMTFALESGEARHSPGPVGLGVFHDVGWGRIAPLVGCDITVNCPIKSFLPIAIR